ncbi:MAG: UbiH/UbiF/VisC/COQ6 family ubiquinone biosynthesis hydroxylase [Glaciecola sp.]
MNSQYDAVIVGAGIVGQALALGLAQAGHSVAVVDKQMAPDVNQNDAFSARVSAISAASESLLTSLGAWQHIQRKQAYRGMQVWDHNGFGNIEFTAQEMNADHLGHIVENDQVNHALYKQCQTYSSIQHYFEQHITHMQSDDQCAELKLESSKVLRTKLLIGADGAHSLVRKAFAFKHTYWDYDHTAIVANVRTEHEHGNIAKQAFTPFGPLAFLPLAEPNTMSIVFSQQSTKASDLLNLSEREFEKALQVAIDNHFGKVSLLTPRTGIPLTMRYARQWTSKHVAVVGDAAHTIHPLAGQGANLGLADAEALLRLIKQQPELLGETKQLRQYERWRKAEAIKVIATMEGFKQLFDGDNAFKKLVRNIGLQTANKVSPLKQFFIQQASS